MALLALVGCEAREERAADDRGWEAFSLGTMPLHYAREGELRYLVSVPRRQVIEELLPEERRFDDRGRLYANNVKMAVRYPSLAPASARDPARDVARLQVGNIVEDAIRRSLDGSWLNHYSIYNVDLPDAFGLHVRGTSSPYDDDRVYFRLSPEMDVRIECHSNVMRRDVGCVMIGKRPGEPYLQTAFETDQLPRWSERLARLQTLFRAAGKAPLELP